MTVDIAASTVTVTALDDPLEGNSVDRVQVDVNVVDTLGDPVPNAQVWLATHADLQAEAEFGKNLPRRTDIAGNARLFVTALRPVDTNLVVEVGEDIGNIFSASRITTDSAGHQGGAFTSTFDNVTIDAAWLTANNSGSTAVGEFEFIGTTRVETEVDFTNCVFDGEFAVGVCVVDSGTGSTYTNCTIKRAAFDGIVGYAFQLTFSLVEDHGRHGVYMKDSPAGRPFAAEVTKVEASIVRKCGKTHAGAWAILFEDPTNISVRISTVEGRHADSPSPDPGYSPDGAIMIRLLSRPAEEVNVKSCWIDGGVYIDRSTYGIGADGANIQNDRFGRNYDPARGVFDADGSLLLITGGNYWDDTGKVIPSSEAGGEPINNYPTSNSTWDLVTLLSTPSVSFVQAENLVTLEETTLTNMFGVALVTLDPNLNGKLFGTPIVPIYKDDYGTDVEFFGDFDPPIDIIVPGLMEFPPLSSQMAQAANPAPVDAAAAVPTSTATIEWGSVVGATTYDVYFGTSPVLDGSDLQGNTASTSFAMPTIQSGVAYYWRIDPRNGRQLTTGAVWLFTTAGATPLVQPTNPGPADAATGVSTATASLTWDAVSGATSYNVYLGTSPNLTASDLQGNVGTNSMVMPVTLDAGQDYFWRVDPRNTTQITTGPEWSFQTLGTPLAQPTVPVPSTGATGVGTSTAALTWTAVPSATSYDVYFSTTTPIVAGDLSGNVSSPSFTVPIALQEGQDYFWRVNPKASGQETAGPEWTFATTLAPLAKAGTPAPADAATDVATSLTQLSWSAVSGALSYNVWVGDSPATLQLRGNVTSTSMVSAVAFPTGLLAGETVYWRVDPRNVAQLTTGDVWSFSTPVPAPSNNRVTDDLVAEWYFDAGTGTTIEDVSGVGAPYDLTVADAGSVSWPTPDPTFGPYLQLDATTSIQNTSAFTKLYDAVVFDDATQTVGSGTFTIEMFIQPSNVGGGASNRPLRAAACSPASGGSTVRNFMMGFGANPTGQDGAMRPRIRANASDLNGSYGTTTDGIANMANGENWYVAFTFDPVGGMKVYMTEVGQSWSGVAVSETDPLLLDGDMSSWDTTYPFKLMNEWVDERGLTGRIYRAAVYSRNKSESELIQNFNALPAGDGVLPDPVVGFANATAALDEWDSLHPIDMVMSNTANVQTDVSVTLSGTTQLSLTPWTQAQTLSATAEIGQNESSFMLNVYCNDTPSASVETATLTINAGSGYTVGATNATLLTVRKDDTAPNISWVGGATSEQPTAVTVVLSVDLNVPYRNALDITVAGSSPDGLQEGVGLDYQLPPMPLTVPIRGTRIEVPVTISTTAADDGKDIVLTIASATEGSIVSPSAHTMTINAALLDKPGAANTGPNNVIWLAQNGGSPVSITGTIASTTINDAAITANGGPIFENFTSSSQITIQPASLSQSVTLRNFEIQPNDINTGYGIFLQGQLPAGVDVFIEDGEIHETNVGLSSNATTPGTGGGRVYVKRLNIHDCGSDATKIFRATTMERCWLHLLGKQAGAHADGMQLWSPTNTENPPLLGDIELRYNNFDMPIPEGVNGPGSPYSSNAAVIINAAGFPIRDIMIENNWMNGGNATVYLAADLVSGIQGTYVNCTLRNNRFGHDTRFTSVASIDNEAFFTNRVLEGNVWDVDGVFGLADELIVGHGGPNGI